MPVSSLRLRRKRCCGISAAGILNRGAVFSSHHAIAPGLSATRKSGKNRHVGDYSREVGQHPVTARHVNLPPNAQPFLVTYGVSSALSRRFGDYTTKWIPGHWGVYEYRSVGTLASRLLAPQFRNPLPAEVYTRSRRCFRVDEVRHNPKIIYRWVALTFP